jgi:hypothetical protein
MFLLKNVKDWGTIKMLLDSESYVESPVRYPCLVTNKTLNSCSLLGQNTNFIYVEDIFPLVEAYFEGYNLFSNKFKCFVPLIKEALKYKAS